MQEMKESLRKEKRKRRGAPFFMYLQPPSSHRSLDNLPSIIYTVVTPMLDPFIYSLRKKEVKGASGEMWEEAVLPLATYKSSNNQNIKSSSQFLTFAFFSTIECHLLAMMAYDLHVAICQPLLYVSIISSRVCWQPVAASYLFAFLSAIIYTWCVFGGSFCGPNRIDHFFCDEVPVLKLVCSDTHNSEMVIFAFITINVVGMSVVILLSYISILCTVLRMCSTHSRARAFHTCASHLMAVASFFGTKFFMYLQPPSSHWSLDKVASIIYTVVTPMLNPFIYSLRNKEVKAALVKCRSRFFNHWQRKKVLSSSTCTVHVN
ncbi:olfactory receptor 8K3-like protein [Amazona aestiva]|uniref:Olfactory receptor 8K3-like protein n=1 Tax=Amazona aestiva TaxID=12930 RepID=A0A0Q3U0D0_AMAAE|nr:olfactory receptor 8K3-like protein [Amazona aestiva]